MCVSVCFRCFIDDEGPILINLFGVCRALDGETESYDVDKVERINAQCSRSSIDFLCGIKRGLNVATFQVIGV